MVYRGEGETTMFWTMFLAVLAALLVMRKIDEFSREHRCWKRYCKAQISYYNCLMAYYADNFPKDDPRRERGLKEYGEQYGYWAKQSKSWVGEMDEDECAEQIAEIQKAKGSWVVTMRAMLNAEMERAAK
jgi:hypothetical protein